MSLVVFFDDAVARLVRHAQRDLAIDNARAGGGAGDGIDIVDATAGTLKVSLTAARTTLCPVGKVFADIHHLNASPGPLHLFRMSLPVKKAVTR